MASRRGGFRGYKKRSRSEEHTSELQSQSNLVCRLLLEKKKEFLHDIYLLVAITRSSLSLDQGFPQDASFIIVSVDNHALRTIILRRILVHRIHDAHTLA